MLRSARHCLGTGGAGGGGGSERTPRLPLAPGVIWDGYLNHGQGGPMLMPADVSLAENVRQAEALRSAPLGEGSSRPQDAAMIAWFLPRVGASMDYQLLYGKDNQYKDAYVDMTNYNFGVVAAAAGYSKDEMLLAAGIVNHAVDLWDRAHGDKAKNTSGPYGNKVQNADMMIKGYEDYVAGRIAPTSR